MISDQRGDLFPSLVDQVSGLIIREALRLTGNNHTWAAKMLGISRPTLLAKIDKYGLKEKARMRED